MSIVPFRSACGLTLLALLPAMFCLPHEATAGAAVGPGVITLPPIVTKYDDRCLQRIDPHDERLAARQSRECRKPRGARPGLPTAQGAEPVTPPSPVRSAPAP